MSAMLMAAMDGGLAGPKWKAMYTDAKGKDLALSPQITDRYQNRHALVALLAHDASAYGISEQPSGVMGLTGTELTSKIQYASGLVGYAQAGVGAARITELFDDQRALSDPHAQQFIDDWFSHFGAMLPTESSKSYLAQQRSLLVVDSSFDRARNSQEFVLSSADDRKSGFPRSNRRSSHGLYAEQSGYNALLSQQAGMDSLFRSAIAQDASLDSSMPKLGAMRQRLGAVVPGDWKDIQKQSATIVSYILSSH